MDVKEKVAEIIVSNNETALEQPQQYIPEKTDSLLIKKILKRLIDILGGIVGTIVLNTEEGIVLIDAMNSERDGEKIISQD